MKSKSELLFVTLFVSLQIYFGFLLHISKVVSSLYVKSAKGSSFRYLDRTRSCGSFFGMPPLFHTGEQNYEFGLWKLNGFLIRAYFPWSGFQPFYQKFDNNFILDFFWSFWYSVSKWMALRLSKKLGKCKGSTRRNNVMSFLLSMFFCRVFLTDCMQ